MAVLEQIIQLDAEDDDEFAWETEDSENDSDDSEEDPTFDLVEKTKSLSINEKRSGRAVTDSDSDDGAELDKENTGTRSDSKDSEQVEEIIHLEQVEKLKVDQLKAYLRRHALRLTGKKDVLIQRVKEHLEIVNGRGEEKYPPSSFVLNCKGDACKGDVVMFEQVVYKKRCKAASTSSVAPPCKKRTVAGRIIKESYGSAKQQHTFTIEVLWSKGDKPLPPLHPLLIKGRNLYKLNTMRQVISDLRLKQNGSLMVYLDLERGKVVEKFIKLFLHPALLYSKRTLKSALPIYHEVEDIYCIWVSSRNSLFDVTKRWEDEAERIKALNEKHSRGSVARSNREVRIQRKEALKNLRNNNKNRHNKGQLPPIQMHNKQHFRPNMIMNQNNAQLRPQFPINKENTCPLPPSQGINLKAPSFRHHHSKAPESFHNHRPPFPSFHDQRRDVASFNGRYQAPMPAHHRYYHKEPALPPYLHATTRLADSEKFRYENREIGHGYGDVNAQRLHRVYHHNSGYYDHPERQPQVHDGHHYPQGRF